MDKKMSLNFKKLEAFAVGFLLLAVSAICMFTANTAEAAARTASQTGPWNLTSTWGGQSVPVAGDTVTMPNANRTVTVPSGYAAACDSITFVAGNRTTSIVLADDTASLTVGAVSGTGNVTINLPAGRTKQINVGAGTFWAKSLTLTGTNGGNITTLAISTGTATITGNITSAGTDSRIVFSGAGTLNAGGTFLSGTPGMLTPSTGTVNYNANGAQTIGAYTYNNLTLSTGGTKTLAAAATVNATLTINGGVTLDTSAANNYALSLGNLSNAGILNANASTITVSGSWTSGGTFNSGLSTVAFAGAGTSVINGSNSFYNLQCLTASKAIQVAQGTTQTVTGLFRINGAAFATRVTLASTGGAGTTWNLVLNGRHDCRYVAVQGSSASGSAYLPINPVGFKDNGNNTNWYDPDLPAEMIFYDNFETSTLASAPPNKTSSNWTITGAGGWYTQSGNVVDTQNHTPGGSKSMYSSGGTSGQGIGCWNNAGWGPVTNGTAVAWFYDDMQNPKYQWIATDNAAGSQWIGVIINTAASTTKYCYYSSTDAGIAVPTFIDRSLGWHEVKWMRNASGTTYLYLDGAELFSSTGISDFSDFDCGTWSWYPTPGMPGSSACWFDDFMVYRSQNQSAYRWYDNDIAQTPTALANENTVITNRNIGTTTRLRLQVQNNQNETWSGANVTLQFRKGANGTWESLSPSADWNYADGLGTDKLQVSNALLTNTNIRQQFVESIPSAANLAMTTGQYGEWDFCINSTGTATLATVYYFRLVVTDAAGVYQRSLASYVNYPQCTLVSPTMTQWDGSGGTAWDLPANWSNGVPDATKDAIIATGAVNDCNINVSGAQCKSLVVQNGRTLTLGTASTGLTVAQDVTVYGTVTHSNTTAALNLNGGILRIDTTGRYNHSGGAINAAAATIQIINGGQYNVSGTQSISAQILQVSVGGLVNVSAGATLNLQDFSMELNGQWLSTNTGNTVNISNNFTNNGSMLGSTGGIFNFTGDAKTMSGSSTTTTFYQANFTGSMTSSITNDVKVLNNLTIAATKSFTSSSGNLNVGGNWTNSGSFIHGGGTVNFNGAAAQLIATSGSTWNKIAVTNSSAGGVSFTDGFTTAYFECLTPGANIFFKANAASADNYVITAANGLQLAGSSGSLINLNRYGGAGTDVWVIDPSDTNYLWSVNYVNVGNSLNIAPLPIMPTNSTDAGNAIYWFAADSNGNGIPDNWEYPFYHNLNTTATADTDFDGLNTIIEYMLGTDPTVAQGAAGTIWVDASATYAGNGLAATPYKYLSDALNAANNKNIVMLKQGTYTLSNYNLSKDLSIKGEDAERTIIKGPTPYGTTSDAGQMLNVTQNTSFSLTNCTVMLYNDQQPVISYDVTKNNNAVVFENVIFMGNNTGSKTLIAPNAGAQGTTAVYMFNCVFHSNTGSYAAELKGNPLHCYNNTVVNNTGGGLLVSGSGNSYLKNNIARGNSTQIVFSAPGSVTYCNVQGGFAGAGNFDSAETYIDPANIDPAKRNFRLATGSPGINSGTATFVSNDISGFARPYPSTLPDVGAYEYQVNDPDGDGIINETGTDPNNPDTDGDGLNDYYEANVSNTPPTLVDNDLDLISDYYETMMGTDPMAFDGQMKNALHRVNLYNESFESDTDYPVGPFSGTRWGAAATYKGDIQVENVGVFPAAYDGSKIITLNGPTRSSIISFVERNDLPDWWISISVKFPTSYAKLPTNVDDAFNIGGIYFSVDSNGRFCVYNGTTKQWMADPQVIPVGTWFRVTIHRDHAAKTADVYLEINKGGTPPPKVFTAVPISGIDLADYIRISLTSLQEYEVQIDRIDGYMFYPW